MRTERTVLRIGKADGTVVDVPMRYNASHQRGYRCFVGDLADAPERIDEDTPRSFEGRSLFEALAEYRKQIEPSGWRLMHAAARRDCWPKPEGFSPYVEKLRGGIEATERMDALDPAPFAEVTSLRNQRAHFRKWMKSLAPVVEGRVPPKAGHEHDEAKVDFSLQSIHAGEYLVDGKANFARGLEILRRRHQGPWWNPAAPKGS